MPMVRALAARLFGRFPLAHPRPDHVVALGAAAQAGSKARHAALADVVMTDVCPFTLGISVRDPTAPDQRTMSPLIERNAIVPISRSGRYYTVADNQAAIVIEVFQGENLRPAQNIKIGELRMPVPLAPAGREGVEVRFTYDVNGALEVEVVGETTGQRERRVFRNEAEPQRRGARQALPRARRNQGAAARPGGEPRADRARRAPLRREPRRATRAHQAPAVRVRNRARRPAIARRRDLARPLRRRPRRFRAQLADVMTRATRAAERP